MVDPLRVSVYDPATGETKTEDLPPGDYMLICAEPCYLDGAQVYPTKGTHVITIKGYTGGNRG